MSDWTIDSLQLYKMSNKNVVDPEQTENNFILDL